MSEAAPATAARAVDALVAIGTWLVVHIEFQSSAEPRFGLRMLDYRVRLYLLPEMKGKRLRQHVIMLGDGTIEAGLRDDDLDYHYQVHYLRDEPVEPFLADPALAPLATLANVSDSDRPAVLARAAALIATIEDDELRVVPATAAADLALLRVGSDIIIQTWKEYAMPIPSFAEALAEHRGEEKYQEGLEQGLEQGRRQMVETMLRHRFGSDERIPALACRLVELGMDECLARCEQARSLDELASSP
jgi:hypothetical protein